MLPFNFNQFSIYFREWELLPDMPLGRISHGCTAIERDNTKYLVVFGGRTDYFKNIPVTDVIVLNMDLKSAGWKVDTRFEPKLLQINKMIHKSLILAQNCFVTWPLPAVTKKNTNTNKIIHFYET